MKDNNNNEISKLTNKLLKVRSKIAKFQEKERNLRDRIESILVRENRSKETVTTASKSITFTRRQNYYIPKASIPALKEGINLETFNSLFTTSYKLKEAAYATLPIDSPCRKAIKEQLTIKPSPLNVSIKEV